MDVCVGTVFPSDVVPGHTLYGHWGAAERPGDASPEAGTVQAPVETSLLPGEVVVAGVAPVLRPGRPVAALGVPGLPRTWGSGRRRPVGPTWGTVDPGSGVPGLVSSLVSQR